MMLFLAIAAIVVIAVLTSASAYTYGRFGRYLQGEHTSALPLRENETDLDRTIAPLVEANGGRNGIALISDNLDAFAARVLAARNAGRSLDLQYYYWKGDLTGRLLTGELLAAADRGVRIRLLLDDINAGLHDRMCLALDAHENIEVRLFNPSRARTDRFKRGLEMMFRPLSATRRMHNKAWIADGRLAIAGGRNIGDAYFDAAEDANFRDLDVWTVGPVVEQITSMFDLYWNSNVVLPIGELRTAKPRYLPALRAKIARAHQTPRGKEFLHYIETAAPSAQAPVLFHGPGTLHWTEHARLAADPPEKAHLQKRQNWIMHDLMPVISAATANVCIISPYFIPGQKGVDTLASLTCRAVSVAVLTNSLAATDVAAVHGAYANYRGRLLAAGIALFELKATHEVRQKKRMSMFGSRGASLHTKAFTVDGDTAFVGSMNFDPRSASLNTEMGIVFRHPDLVADVDTIFREETDPDNSFRLALQRRRLTWLDEVETVPRMQHREPEAGFWRRILSGIIGFLPIESQL